MTMSLFNDIRNWATFIRVFQNIKTDQSAIAMQLAIKAIFKFQEKSVLYKSYNRLLPDGRKGSFPIHMLATEIKLQQVRHPPF